jgi:hypothetical protein
MDVHAGGAERDGGDRGAVQAGRLSADDGRLPAFVLYLAIGAIAIAALSQHPAHTENRVDQVLLCVLLFLGVNMAWLLFMSSPRKADAAGAAPVA